MDTNQISELLREVAALKASKIDWNLILPTVIGLIGVIVAGVINYKMTQLADLSKLSVAQAEKAEKAAEEAKKAAATTSIEVTTVLDKVNGSHEKMVEEVRTLNLRLNAMTAREAALSAVAQQPTPPPNPTA